MKTTATKRSGSIRQFPGSDRLENRWMVHRKRWKWITKGPVRLDLRPLPESARDFFWQYDFEKLTLRNAFDTMMLHGLSRRMFKIPWLRRRFGDDGIRKWIRSREGRGLTREQMMPWVSWRTATRYQAKNPISRIWEYKSDADKNPEMKRWKRPDSALP